MIDSMGKGICNSAIDDLVCCQRIISLRETEEELERVTMDDIRDALCWLHKERRWTLIMRP